MFKNASISKEDAQSILKKSLNWSNRLNDIAEPATASTEAVTNLSKALEGLKSSGGGLPSLDDIFTGIGTTLKLGLHNPLTWIAGAGVTAIGALILKATEFDRAVKASGKSQSIYASTANELATMNSQLDSASQRISELQTKQNQGGLSFAEEAELNTLQLQRTEMERDIQLKEQTANRQSKEAVNDALKALKQTNTLDLTASSSQVYDDFGTAYNVPKETDIVTATANEIEQLKTLKSDRNKLLKELKDPDLSDDEKSTKESLLKSTEADITKYSNNIEDQVQNLQTLCENLSDPTTGIMKNGMSQEAQDYYHSITDILDDFNTIDLSDQEASIVKLDSFFSAAPGRNFIKDTLMESASSTYMLQNALSEMGLTLDDLGVDSVETLKSYLDDAKASADAASKSIHSIDGSFEGVQAAFATANKGTKWSSMAEYLKQAKELYQQGKIGTDDFQSAAQMITPYKINTEDYKYDAEAYAAAWENAYQKVSRWFDTGNPNESMMNFARDLDSVDGQLGNLDDTLVHIDETGARFNLGFKFKSTAEAAKALNTNVEVVEAMLHNLEDSGYEFDDVLFSGDGINQYKESLDGIHEIYNSMNEGNSKDRLGNLLTQWDAEYAGFEENLENLSEEQVIQLRFEYDMASLQMEIGQLQEMWNEGDRSAETGAALNTSKRAYRDEREAQTGYDEADDEGYRFASDRIADLQSQFKSGQSDEERESIQNQISAIYDLQTAFQDAFSDGNAVDWESFLGSSQAQDVMDEIRENTGLTKEDLSDLLDVNADDLIRKPPHIEIEGEVNTTEIEDKMADMEFGGSISFKASVDDAETQITAIKNAQGSISYVALVDGVLQKVTPVTQQDGSISYEIVDSDVNGYTPPEKPGVASYSPSFTNIGSAPTIFGTAIYTASVIGKSLLGLSSGTLLSPAHAYGTGYNAFNTHPAYAGGRVALSQNETALVNELGTESIIRDGRWMLIPGGMHTHALKKGDIILNANQTKSLMKWGKATGKGRAYADGTLNPGLANAYANGTDDKSETFDWIENRIDYLEKLTDEWKNRLDTLTTYKAQNSYINQVAASMQNEIANLNDSYNAYMAKAASLGLDSSYVEKIQKGQISTEDITDEDLKEKIKEYQDWYDKAQDCQTSIEDLNADVRELDEERIDNITDDFDNLSSVFKTVIDYYETMNELAEKQGITLGQNDYDSLIKYNNELKAVKQEELSALQAEFDHLLKNRANFAGSDQYMEMQETLFSLKEELLSIDVELENIKDDIVKADFSSFKQNTGQLKDFSDELDRIDDLLNDNALFDDKGGLTSVGLTRIALLSGQISTARQSMAEYEHAIDQLDQHLANGNITQEEYNESLKEYREGAQNAAADVKKYRDAVIDFVKDGLKQELDANKELISARKEALRSQKEYGDYQEKLNEKNKDIQAIQSQLAALSGQSGKGVDRQRRELEARLKTLEKEKQDILDDRAYDMRLEGYDQASDALEEKYDAFIKDLETDKDVQDKVIADTLQKAADNYGSVADELNKLDVDMSDAVAAPWLSAGAAAEQNQNALGGTSAKSDITTDKIDTSKREEASVIDSITPPSSEEPYKKPEDSSPPPSQSSGQKSPNDLGLDLNPNTKGLDWLARDTSIRDRMLYNGWAATDKNYQLLYGWAGGQGNWTGSAEQNNQILSALKSAGFSQGGILKATGEDGFFLGRNGEAVLTESQWHMVRELANQAPALMQPLPAFRGPENPETVTNVFDAPLIQVEGRADEHTLQELKQLAKDIAPMIGREFYKDARKIGLK